MAPRSLPPETQIAFKVELTRSQRLRATFFVRSLNLIIPRFITAQWVATQRNARAGSAEETLTSCVRDF